MALVTAEEVRNRMAPSETADRDSEIDLCVEAWEQFMVPGVRIEEPVDAVTVWLHGADMLAGGNACGRCSEILHLPPGQNRMVTHVLPDLLTVKEDGLDLVVAEGYSTDADVLLIGANSPDSDVKAHLLRGNAASRHAWSHGWNNVELTYKSGMRSDTAPEWIKHLVCVGAWKLFTVGPTVNYSAVTDAVGAQTLIEKALPPIEREMLDMLRKMWAL